MPASGVGLGVVTGDPRPEPPAWRQVSAEMPFGADEAWRLLTDTATWPRWGPTIRDATLDGPFGDGTTGTVRTVVGVTLPFVLRDVVPGRSWTWDVAGVRATSHAVHPRADGRCAVAFGVPPWALPYLGVCRLALRRLARMA